MREAKEYNLITAQIPIYVLLSDHILELVLESGKLDVKRTKFKDLSSLCNHYSPNNERLERFDMPSDGSFFPQEYCLENIVKLLNPPLDRNNPNEISIYQTLFSAEAVYFYLLARGESQPYPLNNLNLRRNLLGFAEGGLTMVSEPSCIQLGEQGKAFAYGRKKLKPSEIKDISYSTTSVSSGSA